LKLERKKSAKQGVNGVNLNEYTGYFDKALANMRESLGANAGIPTFNSEFQKGNTDTKWKNLVLDGAKTCRGHVEFTFLGPGKKQIEGLSEYFGDNYSTRGMESMLTDEAL
jgi:hypothetical protein